MSMHEPENAPARAMSRVSSSCRVSSTLSTPSWPPMARPWQMGLPSRMQSAPKANACSSINWSQDAENSEHASSLMAHADYSLPQGKSLRQLMLITNACCMCMRMRCGSTVCKAHVLSMQA